MMNFPIENRTMKTPHRKMFRLSDNGVSQPTARTANTDQTMGSVKLHGRSQQPMRKQISSFSINITSSMFDDNGGCLLKKNGPKKAMSSRRKYMNVTMDRVYVRIKWWRTCNEPILWTLLFLCRMLSWCNKM